VVVFDDVTALIQAQRDVAWREVARRMAHEIKNPLTPIQLSAERVRHKYLPFLPEEDRATLDRATRTIIEQVESLKALVNAFSDYARSQRLEAGPVDLNALIRDVVELYKSESGAATPRLVPLGGADTSGDGTRSPVTLKTELDPRLPVITADAGRLRQVLHNLLINARDALAGTPRPVVRIRTRALHEAGRELVEIRIQDNGPGFPDALMEHLFEPYVTSKERGTGLGLAIVKRIVEEHGGAIAAENLKGGGASVTIQLPLTPPLDRHDESGESRPRAIADLASGHRWRA
jgi:nitrogen fixation/metabolism regulation signal transduction histidine kinase